MQLRRSTVDSSGFSWLLAGFLKYVFVNCLSRTALGCVLLKLMEPHVLLGMVFHSILMLLQPKTDLITAAITTNSTACHLFVTNMHQARVLARWATSCYSQLDDKIYQMAGLQHDSC